MPPLSFEDAFPKREHSRLCKFVNTDLDYPEGVDLEKVSIGQIYPDMVLEGRYGNSIRVGGRYSSPYIIISNARNERNHTETNHDGSLMAFFKKGTIRQHFKFDHKLENPGSFEETISELPFVLGSDSIDSGEVTRQELKRFIGDDNYNYGYNDNQIFVNSKRITFNSKSDSIIMSSFDNLIMGSGNNTKLITNGYTSIESSSAQPIGIRRDQTHDIRIRQSTDSDGIKYVAFEDFDITSAQPRQMELNTSGGGNSESHNLSGFIAIAKDL